MRFAILILGALLLRSPQEDERQLLKDARAALRTGNYEGARRALDRLASRRTDDWEPRRLLVRAHLETGKLDDAAALCEAWLQARPDHAGAKTALAQVLLEQDEPAKAFDRLAGLTSVQARYLRARALIDLGRDDEALKIVEPFVEEHNKGKDELMKDDLFALARGLILYANLAMESEIYKQAVRYITPEILKADPQDAHVKTFLGDCYLERHNKDAAQRSYQEALGTNSSLVPALLGLAELAILNGQYPGAIPLCERALTIDAGSSRAHYLRALVSLGMQDPAGARTMIEKGLKARPKSPRLRSLLAAVAHLQEKTDERDAEIKKVLEVNPKSPHPYLEIGRALLGSGWQYHAANLFLKKAADQNPRYWPALVEYGMNCLRVADEETGAKILRDANKKDPFNVRVQNLVNLLDEFEKDFVALAPNHYKVRIEKAEQAWMEPYVLELLDRAWTDMTKRYGFAPKEPVLVEVFGNHGDFSVRTTGVPGIGALGACFGQVVTTLSPRAAGQVGQAFNWGAVLWHEMAHVFALQLSEYRVPRWFTEGLATYEENKGFGGWEREIDLEMMQARHRGDLNGVSGLESGRPGANPILVMYHQGSWICEYLDTKFGFDKIVKLLQGYAKKKKTAENFREVLGVSLDEFDKGFFAWMDARFAKNLYRLPPKETAAKLQADFAKNKTGETAVKLCAALLAANDAKGAKKVGEEAVKLAPDDPWAHAYLGQALYVGRWVEEAIEELEKAVKLGPCDWHTWMALGNAYLDEERPMDAVRAFEKARDCFPRLVNGENAYRKLNEAHLALKEYDAALKALEQMLEVDHLDFKNRIKVAKLHAERRNWDKVAKLLSEAAWVETRDKTLHDLLAQASLERGETEKAIRHWTIVVALVEAGETTDESGDRAEAYTNIGEAYLRLGDKTRARGYAKDALRLSPGHERAKKLFEQTGP